MKRSFGLIFMFLGMLMLFGALVLYIHNEQEDQRAQESVEYYLPQIMQVIEENIENQSRPTTDSTESATTEEPTEQTTELPIDPGYYDPEMTVEMIDGYGFVGYLSIPSLDLQLPVLAETDYGRLKMSPCRFYGSTKTDDLVIGAHNYSRHFGKISGMKIGDALMFTDMDGKQWKYCLAAMEVLQPDAVEDLTNGEFPLTLFTCTYGGRSRVTLRCDLVTE